MQVVAAVMLALGVAAQEDFVAMLQVTADISTAGPIQAAWDNHLLAFGNVSMTLEDYTDESVVTVYNQNDDTKVVFTGLAGVREFITGFLTNLHNTSDFHVPYVKVEETSGAVASVDGVAPVEAVAAVRGSVLVIWECPASGYEEATDTFIFDADDKIFRQNVVVAYTPTLPPVHRQAALVEAPLTRPGRPAARGQAESQAEKRERRAAARRQRKSYTTAATSSIVSAAWGNHFGAFGLQNVSMILEDYTKDSVVKVYNQFDSTMTEYKGLNGVEVCFTKLFCDLRSHATNGLAAPEVFVEEAPGLQVFLIWSAAASGFERATDTFIFDAEGKISRQNVVVNYDETSVCGQVSSH